MKDCDENTASAIIFFKLCSNTYRTVLEKILTFVCAYVIVQYAGSFRQYKGLWLGVCDVWCNNAVWSAGTSLGSSIASCQASNRGWGPSMALQETDALSQSLRPMLGYIKKCLIISNFAHCLRVYPLTFPLVTSSGQKFNLSNIFGVWPNTSEQPQLYFVVSAN